MIRQYERAAERLREIVQDSPAGTRLPPDPQLGQALGVSRGTALRALKIVEGEGLVESVHGRGRFVIGPNGARGNRHDAAYERITHDMHRHVNELPHGTALPHVNDLAMAHSVSSMTMRRILKGLAGEGVLHTRARGFGYFTGPAK